MRKRAIAVAVSAAILTAAGIGMAAASVPDSSGSIHGCYGNSDGRLRVIDSDAGQVCNQHSETSLDWAQVGPQGPAGPQGVPSVQTYYEVQTALVPVAAGDSVRVEADCNPGDIVLSGGYFLRPTVLAIAEIVMDAPLRITDADPSVPPFGWIVGVRNTATDGTLIKGIAIIMECEHLGS